MFAIRPLVSAKPLNATLVLLDASAPTETDALPTLPAPTDCASKRHAQPDLLDALALLLMVALTMDTLAVLWMFNKLNSNALLFLASAETTPRSAPSSAVTTTFCCARHAPTKRSFAETQLEQALPLPLLLSLHWSCSLPCSCLCKNVAFDLTGSPLSV